VGRDIIVDVSGYQTGEIPWSDAAKHAEQRLIGAIIKFTQEDFESKAAFRHAAGAKAAGVPIGAYHFAVPQKPIREDAQKEAQRFVQKIREMASQGLTLDMYPFLDLESGEDEISDVELVEWATIFCDFVTGALALDKMGLYMNKKYVKHLVKGRGENLAKHILWIAGDNPEVPPGIWSKPMLWQTPERILPYYSEKIDIDIAPEGICPLLIRNSSAAIAKCGAGGASKMGTGMKAFLYRLSTPQKIAVAGGAVVMLGVGGWLLWSQLKRKKK